MHLCAFAFSTMLKLLSVFGFSFIVLVLAQHVYEEKELGCISTWGDKTVYHYKGWWFQKVSWGVQKCFRSSETEDGWTMQLFQQIQ